MSPPRRLQGKPLPLVCISHDLGVYIADGERLLAFARSYSPAMLKASGLAHVIRQAGDHALKLSAKAQAKWHDEFNKPSGSDEEWDPYYQFDAESAAWHWITVPGGWDRTQFDTYMKGAK